MALSFAAWPLAAVLGSAVCLGTGTNGPATWTFRNDVQPVLAKAGCSSGACHGAAAGQGGFKLSLRGYDDAGDHHAITRHAVGRRINRADPGRSLLLLKATATVAHKGGTRFEVDSPEYRILSEWIASGAPGPAIDDPRITRIEVQPARTHLQPGATQALQVFAHFTDGSRRDVSRWTKYGDANASVTQTDDLGHIAVQGFGEGAVTAWYLSKIAMATVTVPLTNAVEPGIIAGAPRRNFIDGLVLAKLEELNIPPSPRSTDAVFLRRAFLDTIGTLPTAAEARAFLADTAAGKRDALIESLLQRPEFVDYWTYKWSDLLLVNSDKLRPTAMWAYHQWIKDNVAANTPWDQFAQRVVTASGSALENGAANFYVLHEDPPNMAETVSQAFLGMSINCAKCHNHPMEKWTNDEYFGFANLFARVRVKMGAVDGDRIIFAAAAGDITQPLTGRPQAPRPLDGTALALADPSDRREALARWLTAPENPYFTRAVVNRVWANFFGVGLVEKVDDLRVTNPASNEHLLAAAARHLVTNRFDLKALMRAILQSETYQRSSDVLAGNSGDQRFHSRYYPRRLMAEVLLDAYSQVTGVPTEFRTDLRNQNRGLGDRYPAGIRALQLPDSKVFSYFLKAFGRADREKTCECERTAEPSMAQALHIANGDTLNQKLAAREGRVAQLLAAPADDERLLEDVFLSALARFPTDRERTEILRALRAAPASGPERRAAIEDLLWAVLSTREFLFTR